MKQEKELSKHMTSAEEEPLDDPVCSLGHEFYHTAGHILKPEETAFGIPIGVSHCLLPGLAG